MSGSNDIDGKGPSTPPPRDDETRPTALPGGGDEPAGVRDNPPSGVADPGDHGDVFVHAHLDAAPGAQPTRMPLADSIRANIEGKDGAIEALKLPDRDFKWNDRMIEKRVKVIQQVLASLTDSYNPLKEGHHSGEIVSDPLIARLFIRIFQNLNKIINQTEDQWLGIRLFARWLATRCYEQRVGLAPKLLDEMVTTLGLTKNTPHYKPLVPEAASQLGFAVDHRIGHLDPSITPIQIDRSRLNDDRYRQRLARKLFRLSRANPYVEQDILIDLHGLAFGPEATSESRRQVVLLLRELTPLTEKKVAFTADDALTVRDYAPILHQDKPAHLLIPSTLFPPDHWTQTMNAGLGVILESEDLAGSEALEIGTGGAILSLFVANNSKVTRIQSVDINRIATVVAPLNLLLAYANKAGDLESDDVLKRFEFGHTADLFTGVPKGKKFKLIFACIPQAPSPVETISDRDLADNYIARGYPEDIDGLGLLAQMLDQAEDYLEEGGKVALIVSGRPGLAAIQRMANLRGWAPTTVYPTEFHQHRTTDLSGYVEIEKLGLRLSFEFWWKGHQITAARAKEILDSLNRKIEGLSAEDNTPKKIADLEGDPKYLVTHKQYIIEFKPLSHLRDYFASTAQQAYAKRLRASRSVRYFTDTGIEYEPYTQSVAAHLSSMMGAVVTKDTLFVAPTLDRLLYNFTLTTTHSGEPIFIDPSLQLSNNFHRNLKRWQVHPEPSIQDRLRIYALTPFNGDMELEMSSAHRNKRFVVFVAGPRDGNALHKVANILYEHPNYQRYVSVVWQNTHLPLEHAPLATMVLLNRAVFETMVHVGKDTYSRVSQQAIYEASLLQAQQVYSAFNIDFTSLPRRLRPIAGSLDDVADRIRAIPGVVPASLPRGATLEPVQGDKARDLSSRARSLETFPAHPPRLGKLSGVVDMTFGESEFLIPPELLEEMIQSLLVEPTDADLRKLIAEHLERTRVIKWNAASEIQFGAGVHPLLAQTLRTPEVVGDTENFTVLLPRGYYGYFPSTIHAAGGETESFGVDVSSTDPEFILDEMHKAYDRAAARGKPVRAILINYPTNPAGLFYSPQNLKAIAAFCRDRGITILADEVFFNTARPEVKTSMFNLLADPEVGKFLRSHLIGYTGASKSPGLGGLRFAMMFSKNSELLSAINGYALETVDPIARRIANKVYQPSYRARYIEAHLKWLEAKRGAIVRGLTPFAQKDLIHFKTPQGGYFLEVDVSPLFGLEVSIDGRTYTISPDGDNLRSILFESVGVQISLVGWSGNPGTVRLVYSLQNLDEGISRLKKFFHACDEAKRQKRAVEFYKKPEGVSHNIDIAALLENTLFVLFDPDKMLETLALLLKAKNLLFSTGLDPIEDSLIKTGITGLAATYRENRDRIDATTQLALLAAAYGGMITDQNHHLVALSIQELTFSLQRPEDVKLRDLLQITTGTFPSTIVESDLRHFLQTVDGEVRTGHMQVEAQPNGGTSFEINFVKGGRDIGKMMVDLEMDESGESLYVSRWYIDIFEPGNYYGFELVSQFIRYCYWNQNISRCDMTASDVGRYLWSFLDGFKLEPHDVRLAKIFLRRIKKAFDLPLTARLISQAITPYKLRQLKLDKPDRRLLDEARQAYSGLPLDDKELLEKTRYVGEMALFSLENAYGARVYSMALNLTPNHPDYLVFERSVAEFWDRRNLPRRAIYPAGEIPVWGRVRTPSSTEDYTSFHLDPSSIQVEFEPSKEFQHHPPRMIVLKDGMGGDQVVILEGRNFASAIPLIHCQFGDDGIVKHFSDAAVILARRPDGSLVGYTLVGHQQKESPDHLEFYHTYKCHNDDSRRGIKALGAAMAAYTLGGFGFLRGSPTQQAVTGIDEDILFEFRNRTYRGRRSPVSPDGRFKGQRFDSSMPEAEALFLIDLFKDRLGPVPPTTTASNYGRLTILNQLPEAVKTTSITTEIGNLGGPTAIHLNFGRRSTRVVSVLVHGNEPSGFQAVLRHIQLMHLRAGQRSYTTPPTNIVFLIQNVRAARKDRHSLGHRYTADQADLNLAWADLLDPSKGLNPYVQETMEFLRRIHREAPIEAIIDLHDTSGKSPPFSVLGRSADNAHDLQSQRLAALFTDHVIRVRKSGFDGSMRVLAPSVCIECGKMARRGSAKYATEVLRQFLSAPEGFLEGETSVAQTYRQTATVHLRDPNESMSLWGGSGNLRWRGDLEAFNFKKLERADWIAEWDGEGIPLRVLNGDMKDVTGEYFALAKGKIYLIKSITVAMASLYFPNIRRSEVFHIVEPEVPPLRPKDPAPSSPTTPVSNEGSEAPVVGATAMSSRVIGRMSPIVHGAHTLAMTLVPTVPTLVPTVSVGTESRTLRVREEAPQSGHSAVPTQSVGTRTDIHRQDDEQVRDDNAGAGARKRRLRRAGRLRAIGAARRLKRAPVRTWVRTII